MRVYSVEPEPLPEGCRSLPAAALEQGITIRLAGRRITVEDFKAAMPREGWVGIYDGKEWWALNATRNVEVLSFEKGFLDKVANTYEPKRRVRK